MIQLCFHLKTRRILKKYYKNKATITKVDLPLWLAPSPPLLSWAFPSCNVCCISFWRPCSNLLSAQTRSSPEDTRTPRPPGSSHNTKEFSVKPLHVCDGNMPDVLWTEFPLTLGSLECSGHKTWSLLQYVLLWGLYTSQKSLVALWNKRKKLVEASELVIVI